MSIYDCFTYFDEDLVLDLRFNILDKYVDKFIVVESTLDHSGKEKKMNFDINKFSKFKNKIIYYIVDDMPKNVKSFKKNWSSNFVRENFQRNAIQRCIENCKENDLILISDADEIPNLEVLNNQKLDKFALFKQILFMYKINLVNKWDWLGSGISYFKHLKTPQWLRNKRFLRRGFLRRLFFKTQIFQNGGWHFSYLKSPQEILLKTKSFAHGEFSNIGLSTIIKRIENKKQIFSLDSSDEMKELKISNTHFPEYIVNNQEKFKDWIIKN